MTFISPMLLHKTENPFDSADYITELKLDGIRLLYTRDLNGHTKLYTRHHNDVTSKFPELVALNVAPGTVLDGEIIVTDDLGKPDFEAMMSRFQSRFKTYPVSYVVFDVLQYKGQSVAHLPLLERKSLLANLIPKDDSTLAKVQFIEGNATAFFDLAVDQSLEGIVIKQKNSKYEIGRRSHSWLKVINYQYKDVFVTGYPKDEFGWLLADDNRKPLGIMELGVPLDAKRKAYQATKTGEDDLFVYIEPFKCRVKYRHLTKMGLLRLPSFVEFVSPPVLV
ncbi:ATP-dependent DNA ligase [Litchfieldia alkalitelluris]|uniref:ATP-dependent DNA ligase n=1 Tax=Litchfieldia alkalitelluris TaxID=304268 RepID=UPI001F32E927|nr:ATP-dependent DNA ligase [Litchfieldia alkalitelluris]